MLKNQIEAYKLIGDIKLAINKRLEMPLPFEPYHSCKVELKLKIFIFSM